MTPINLNKERKAREKLAKKKRADENAKKFGLSKSERALEKARAAKAAQHIDAHKRET